MILLNETMLYCVLPCPFENTNLIEWSRCGGRIDPGTIQRLRDVHAMIKYANILRE